MSPNVKIFNRKYISNYNRTELFVSPFIFSPPWFVSSTCVFMVCMGLYTEVRGCQQLDSGCQEWTVSALPPELFPQPPHINSSGELKESFIYLLQNHSFRQLHLNIKNQELEKQLCTCCSCRRHGFRGSHAPFWLLWALLYVVHRHTQINKIYT